MVVELMEPPVRVQHSPAGNAEIVARARRTRPERHIPWERVEHLQRGAQVTDMPVMMLGATVREWIVVLCSVLSLVLSTLSLHVDGYVPLWTIPSVALVAVVLPASAAALLMLRRYAQPTLSVGSIGVDQVCAMTSVVMLLSWVGMIAVLPGAIVAWLGVLTAAGCVAVTCFGPVIPGLQRDFDDRDLRQQTAFAAGARVWRPRPTQTPAQAWASYVDYDIEAAQSVPSVPERTRPAQKASAARFVHAARGDAPLEHVSPEAVGARHGDASSSTAAASELLRPAVGARASEAVRADEAWPGGFAAVLEDEQENSTIDREGMARIMANRQEAAQRAEAAREAATRRVRVHAAAERRAHAEAAARAHGSQHAEDAAWLRAKEDAAGSRAGDASNASPRRRAFWALVPEQRGVVDASGATIFYVGPTAWVLVLEDRGSSFFVRTDDGRVGLLRNVTGVIRN